MFESVTMAPADPILGLSEAFQKDDRANKINLSVGVYKDAEGKTPVLKSVKMAEQKILDSEGTKSYMPIGGSAKYGQLSQKLLFGEGSSIIENGRASSAHTPGGTGGLRVAGNLISELGLTDTVLLSDPTWANHKNIFAAAGLKTQNYRYFNRDSNSLDMAGLLADLNAAQAGQVVVLHGCCHNPTGQDLTLEQWGEVAELIKEKNLLPLIDFAYQGFATGIEEDAAGLRKLAETVDALLVCSSYSKNFGLYRERVGALTIVAADSEKAAVMNSQLKRSIRCNYSNPPAHGASVVETILDDAELRVIWEGELLGMRERINGMRELFAKTLTEMGKTLPSGDNDFITKQNGMFSFSGLSPEQVTQLREKDGVYMVGSGRINVAGMTESNMKPLCEAIASVL